MPFYNVQSKGNMAMFKNKTLEIVRQTCQSQGLIEGTYLPIRVGGCNKDQVLMNSWIQFLFLHILSNKYMLQYCKQSPISSKRVCPDPARGIHRKNVVIRSHGWYTSPLKIWCASESGPPLAVYEQLSIIRLGSRPYRTVVLFSFYSILCTVYYTVHNKTMWIFLESP